MNDTPTDLYRYFASDGQLLYVGISLSAAVRAMGHRASAGWWTDWARCDVERFNTRAAALEAERQAIITERPIHNIVHNRGSGDSQACASSTPTPAAAAGFVGTYFHTPDPDDGFPLVQQQGHIALDVGGGVYLVQLYSWLTGCPTNQRIATIDEMLGWKFYTTHAEWVDAGDRASERRDRRDETAARERDRRDCQSGRPR